MTRQLRAAVRDRLARRSSRRAGVVLAYHRIGRATGSKKFELVPAIGRAAFERQLRHLCRSYRVVAAAEILAAVGARRMGDRFPVAITFDDDLSCHARDAAPCLTRAGLPATFFLSGASFEGAFAFWWEDLQRAVDERMLEIVHLPQLGAGQVGAAIRQEPRAIRRLAAGIERLPPATRSEVVGTLRDLVGPPAEGIGMTPDDVRALVDGGFEIGFHTLGHPLLTELDDRALGTALVEGRDRLAAVAGRDLTLVAYPHGKADRRVAEAARAAGFEFAFTGQNRVVEATTDPMLVTRIEPEADPADFALQLARALGGSD